ncbi:hypothetical protein SAMN04487911_12524 [Arenibacter nanhaiticus]|uniref:Uncharacterized protein n=1 Tax=Arenibacter nanhaiticus TaxID=558155 RepID=A0A1M6KC17_9FLAO|nr:hypothetical protein SAMN04487911_12524 [Arenibacter nanhaiticus]
MRTKIAPSSFAFFKAFVYIFVLRFFLAGLPLLRWLFIAFPISEGRGANQYGGNFLKASIDLALKENFVSTFNRGIAQQ